MKRSDRMEKLASISSNFEHLAGATLSTVQAQYQKELNQLEQLKIYREDYQRLLKERLNSSISSREIQDYKFFFSSLDSAIHQQEETLKQCEAQLATVKNNWLNKHLETRKMEKATNNIRAEEQAESDKAQQQEMNEVTGQFHGKNGNFPEHH